METHRTNTTGDTPTRAARDASTISFPKFTFDKRIVDHHTTQNDIATALPAAVLVAAVAAAVVVTVLVDVGAADVPVLAVVEFSVAVLAAHACPPVPARSPALVVLVGSKMTAAGCFGVEVGQSRQGKPTATRVILPAGMLSMAC